MKNNYEAWDVTPDNFPRNGTNAQKLTFLCRYGVLAPSGHNSQPWELCIQDDTLILSISQRAHLSAEGSGLLSAEPHVSLGCFLGTIDLAAQGFGLKLRMDILARRGDYARVSIIDGAHKKNPSLLTAISTRSSNRNEFLTQGIDPQTLSAVTEGLPKEVKSLVLEDADREFIADKTKEALDIIMAEPKYRQELSQWVRPNMTRSYDGMPGFTHGVPAVPSIVGKWMVKHMPGKGPQGEKSKRMMLNSGAVLIIGTKDRSARNLIDAGIAYSKICIQANLNGLASSALGAAVIEPSIKDEVVGSLQLDFEPTYVLRLGYSDEKPKHSPRRPIENTKLAADC